jgi:hypothetical protein
MPVTEIWEHERMTLGSWWRPKPGFFVLSPIYWARGALDSGAGNPAPSLKLNAGYWPVRLAVKSGARTVKVDVRQPDSAAARPVLRVKANPAIGLAADVTATAGSGTDWQTVQAAFTATADGGAVIELENPDPEKPCWFDNVVLT